MARANKLEINVSSYPSADDYAFSLEPARLSKYLKRDEPLLRTIASGKVVRRKGSHYAHFANGFFAYIYKVSTASGTYAIRCPRIQRHPTSAIRYRSLSDFLRHSNPPSYLVEADQFDKALFVSVGSQGGWFPVQVMAWIAGKTLLEVVSEKVRANDQPALARLAEAWENLLIEMKEDGVVHGDLHPDNVIVGVDNTLRLVDYDTIDFPSIC